MKLLNLYDNIVVFLFLLLRTTVNKNEWKKNSRNEKYKYSNEEKLALGEDENRSALQILPRRMTSTYLNCYKTCEQRTFDLSS